jgi:hypothetical protein
VKWIFDRGAPVVADLRFVLGKNFNVLWVSIAVAKSCLDDQVSLQAVM